MSLIDDERGSVLSRTLAAPTVLTRLVGFVCGDTSCCDEQIGNVCWNALGVEALVEM